MNGSGLKMFQEDAPLAEIDPEVTAIIEAEKNRQVLISNHFLLSTWLLTENRN